ncbi:YjiH family protein [Nesterenkonia populi]|uniref:YjiH family protein n=1 Tax=Nesterenkonia populi TaxID=1591087 RepID=UPI0011BE04DC|nr:YjiH family protein [Nesterenkonia populi]
MTAVQNSRSAALWFILPSLLGVFIFMVPVPDGAGSLTIPIAWMAGNVGDALAALIPWLLLALLAVSAVGTILYRAARPALLENEWGRTLFKASPFWLVTRVLGLVFGVAILFQLGPEWIWGDDTGGLILELASLLVVVFALAGFLLPLLLSFGLLDFAGALLTTVMRPLFKVPGRSSVVGLTSWLGDGTIGVLMTNQQYVQGHYTKREAAVLGTTFNIVSVTFIVVILGYLSLEHMFAPFYLTIIAAGLAAAIIMPRIPPLSRFPDELAEGITADPRTAAHAAVSPGTGQKHDEEQSQPLLRRAWDSALTRGSQVRVREVARSGASNALEMWLAVIPIILAVGTIAVVIAEHTPLFSWLGYPFVPVLELMQVPEAQAASETVLIGFADMLLPAIIGAGIEAEMTRFIIGALSVSQLIFMSETGGMLLASRIPVKFHHLVMIFLGRTIITLPIIVGMAHLFY